MLPKAQGGVVDGTLRVYGLSNVRVADASVPPIALSTHLMASTYGVAEIAAAVIREFWNTGSQGEVAFSGSSTGATGSQTGSSSSSSGSGSSGASKGIKDSGAAVIGVGAGDWGIGLFLVGVGLQVLQVL